MTKSQEENLQELRKIIERLAKLGVAVDMRRPIDQNTFKEEQDD